MSHNPIGLHSSAYFIQPHYGPGVHSAFNKWVPGFFLGVGHGRRVRLTTSLLSVSRQLDNAGSSMSHNHIGLLSLLRGIALLFYLFNRTYCSHNFLPVAKNLFWNYITLHYLYVVLTSLSILSHCHNDYLHAFMYYPTHWITSILFFSPIAFSITACFFFLTLSLAIRITQIL
jgi:hypothetical protein